MSPEVLAALLGSGGIAAVLAAVVAAVSTRRKLGAEATEIITNAAAGVVKNMQAEIDRQVKRNTEIIQENEQRIELLTREHSERMNAMVDSHNQEMEDVRRVLQLHVAWDAIAIAKMNDFGVTLPPAPPLLPPIKREHPPID